MLHVVGRGRGTIKQVVGKLHKNNQMHKMDLHTRGCTVAWMGWKGTVAGTIHDKMYHLRRGGVGGR